MLLENPKRGRGRPRKRRGVGKLMGGIKMPTMRNPFLGISTIEVAGAVGGLAAATLIPTLLIKAPTTTLMKIAKVAVSFATAITVGSLMRSIAPSASRAATFGGVAAAGRETLAMFVPAFKLGGGIPTVSKQIGVADLVSPSRSREGESVSMIQP